MRAILLRWMTLLAIALVAWYVASGPSLQARGGEPPKQLVPVPAPENGGPAATPNGSGGTVATPNGNGVSAPAVNGNGVPAYPHPFPPGAYNYFVHPGEAGRLGAQLYVEPRPTPPLVGHTYITYPPLMPHEFLYQHRRVYETYNPGSGTTRTRVRWH
jgi:hypothetical protein